MPELSELFCVEIKMPALGVLIAELEVTPVPVQQVDSAASIKWEPAAVFK